LQHIQVAHIGRCPSFLKGMFKGISGAHLSSTG
jgi:hypothetical protein